jgi:hypothetical protein
MRPKHAAARVAATNVHAQGDDDAELEELEDAKLEEVHEGAELEEVHDYGKLRELLTESLALDSYCRSALYFALTGRTKTGASKIWIVSYQLKHLILLSHPNIAKTLLVFFPFVATAMDLVTQLDALCKCKKFLSRFEGHEIRLARIPKTIAEEFFSEHLAHLLHCKAEQIQEDVLDWVYPSYDIDLQKLLNLEGRKLKIYRKKLRQLLDQPITVHRPRDIDPADVVKIVRAVNKGWIRTKRSKDLPAQTSYDPSARDLMSCYRAMANFNMKSSIAIDGLILKRGEEFLAFSFWEPPSPGKTVACLAALPVSHEKGLSEYLYYVIAKRLRDEGHKTMCIGGSETPSLDQFKRKLDPSEVHELRTIRVIPSAINLVTSEIPTEVSAPDLCESITRLDGTIPLRSKQRPQPATPAIDRRRQRYKSTAARR